MRGRLGGPCEPKLAHWREHGADYHDGHHGFEGRSAGFGVGFVREDDGAAGGLKGDGYYRPDAGA